MNAPVRFEAASLPLPAAEPIVRFDGVCRLFAARRGSPAVRAIDDLTLDVAPGEIFGVIGRSGAGKSTLIRLINGLERPTSGRVLVEGVDVGPLAEAALRPLRRSIGMVFQHFNLLSSRSVFDNVALPLEVAGAGKAEIRRSVGELLDLVGLADKRNRYPAELSGGQKQRVGIARALATRPKILLGDEVTSALDPETTASILALLADINRTFGVTIVLITHEIAVVKDICHRVAVLEAGRLIETGRTFDVLTRPHHATTASFVRNVAGVELPADIAQRLTHEPGPGRQALLRITFSGSHATAPVISRLTTVLGIDVNILAGRIDSIAGEPFGALLVSMPGEAAVRLAAVSALRALQLQAEVVGYVA
ncbi:methionine ABC transporter ATP-binding protein [Labrys monachus]|uniref:D-methionine transport system ATP-binding protein n=1 Tax=Labrys monachus TaxID=217067 RepID=A0ABU0FHW3_9HYPH|nr:methionine ABC transporter ATP-binding protein [Labrys monachus]MDQ0394196.1 D-methionine transport system ATP-binding protein [Labrys monachus]